MTPDRLDYNFAANNPLHQIGSEFPDQKLSEHSLKHKIVAGLRGKKQLIGNVILMASAIACNEIVDASTPSVTATRDSSVASLEMLVTTPPPTAEAKPSAIKVDTPIPTDSRDQKFAAGEPSATAAIQPTPEASPDPIVTKTPESVTIPVLIPTPAPIIIQTSTPVPTPKATTTPEAVRLNTPTQTPAKESQLKEGFNQEQAQYIFERINAIRKEFGLGELKLNSVLTAAEKKYVKQLAESGNTKLDHNIGGTPSDRARIEGYMGNADEILALQPTIASRSNNPILSTVGTWMASPGHRAAILNSKYKEIGVACFEVRNPTVKTINHMFCGATLGTPR